MKTVYRESIVTIAVILVFVVWGCSHTKKDTSETAAVPEEVVETVEVDEEEVVEVPVEVISNLSNIYFDFDKSVLSREAIEELKEIGAWLLENPNTKIRIEGNCDERGTDEYNLALGERRARSAKNFLVSLGVATEKIITISFGEENPADPGHNEMAWGKNRRDEFNIVD
jgi:peptidoglycan-associated lipoprotein